MERIYDTSERSERSESVPFRIDKKGPKGPRVLWTRTFGHCSDVGGSETNGNHLAMTWKQRPPKGYLQAHANFYGAAREIKPASQGIAGEATPDKSVRISIANQAGNAKTGKGK